MAFFYPHRFREVRSVLENVNLGEFILIRLQTPRERKNRIHLDEYYFFNAAIPPKEEFGTNRRHALDKTTATGRFYSINWVQYLGPRDPSPSQIHGTSSRFSWRWVQFSRESTFYLYFVKVESGFSRNSSVSGWSPTETSELESKTSRGITTLKM
jgi:hypothetical protein